jgi:hypothetical protein
MCVFEIKPGPLKAWHYLDQIFCRNAKYTIRTAEQTTSTVQLCTRTTKNQKCGSREAC